MRKCPNNRSNEHRPTKNAKVLDNVLRSVAHSVKEFVEWLVPFRVWVKPKYRIVKPCEVNNLESEQVHKHAEEQDHRSWVNYTDQANVHNDLQLLH